MVALIAIVLALVVLAAWLSGHWFARVIVMLVLGGFVWAVALEFKGTEHGIESSLLAFILGLPCAWVIASLPTYYWRHRNKVLHHATVPRVVA
jgi:hypothetical protein